MGKNILEGSAHHQQRRDRIEDAKKVRMDDSIDRQHGVENATDLTHIITLGSFWILLWAESRTAKAF